MTSPRQTIEAGQTWRRTLGVERVLIGRAWHGHFTGVEDDYVRCHPLNGGRAWTTTQRELRLRFHLVAPAQSGRPASYEGEPHGS